MSKKVVQKLLEWDVSSTLLNTPIDEAPKMRFAAATGVPLIQTSETTFTYDDAASQLELVCSEIHAEKLNDLDDFLCQFISSNSTDWFGRSVTYDQVEKMYVASLHGTRMPRHILNADTMKVFDAQMQLTDGLSTAGSGIFIIRLEGVRFEEKSCEAIWTVVQAKECEVVPPTHPATTEPMFL